MGIAFFKLKWNVALMENAAFQQVLAVVSSKPFLFAAAGVILYLGILAAAYRCAVKIMEQREF